MQQIGVGFELLDIAVDETPLAGEEALAHVERLALEKARAGRDVLAGKVHRPVLGADTIVVADGIIMGKPRDRVQAVEMLQRLSGCTHQVMSAVALVAEQAAVRVSTSHVTFRTLSRAECTAYWETGEPAGKAGAYAIQGLAAMFISRLEGSYSGVMGLPIYETAELLQAFGVRVL